MKKDNRENWDELESYLALTKILRDDIAQEDYVKHDSYASLIEDIRNTMPLDIHFFVWTKQDYEKDISDYELPCPIYLTDGAQEIYRTDPRKSKRFWRKNYPFERWV